MASNFLRMLFGQGTEPTYAGLRMPRQRVEDDAMLIRQGNPQERYRDYHAEDDAKQRRLEQVMADQDAENHGSRDGKIKGAISGLGQMFAGAMQPEQTQPLQFAQLQQQQLTPLIDPRFLRYAGGRADGGTVKRGSWAKVHKGEAVIATPEGDTVVVPKGQIQNLEDEVMPNEQPPTKGRRAVNWDVKETAEQPLPPVKDVQATETVTPDSVTETVTEEPSIADLLRQKMEVRQKRLAEGATKNPDGTTTYGGKQYRKRNAFDALKSAGLGVLQSLATAQVNPNDPNPLSSMLGRAIGGAGAGAIMGATMNNVDERMMDKMKLAQLAPQYEQAYGMERQKKADDLKEENIRFDNDLNKLRIESAIGAKADSEKGKAVVALNKLKWFDPKNPTHAALAKRAGLDVAELQGWDDRRPFTKNVAGVEYVYKDGAFMPSNLPIDEAKTLKDYTVEMPNGEKRTYRVSQKDAANFSTQMSALGARLAQQESEFTRRQTFTKAQNDEDRALRVQLQKNAQEFGREVFTKKAVDAYKLAFTKENGRPPTQAEIDTYVTGTVESILGESGFTPLP